jgi:transposase
MAANNPFDGASYGLNTNDNGGQYQNGRSYDMVKKFEVAKVYKEMMDSTGKASSRNVAAATGVSKKFALKVINEVTSGGLVDPATVERDHVRGRGARSLTVADEALLLSLYNDCPSRSLNNYKKNLYQTTGTYVDESTISRWFNHRHPFKGSVRKSNMVPIDKYKPENIARAINYVAEIAQFHPSKLKFGDEKHLKGAEIFVRGVRRNPITGVVPDTIVDSDFRNTYNLTGFCGIDPRSAPMSWTIQDGINDSESFSHAIERAVASNFLKRHDVLVLDNASIHRFQENVDLDDWLWNVASPIDGRPLQIYLMFLPTRSPELNPIELLWNMLVQRLKMIELARRREHNHALVTASTAILNGFTHYDVWKCYKHCRLVS